MLILDAFIEEGSELRPFQIAVSSPQPSGCGEEYFCQIRAPELFGKDKKIYGVSETQARSLAIKFVKEILSDRRIVDKQGNTIDIDGIGFDSYLNPTTQRPT